MNRNIFEFFTEPTLVGFPAGMCEECPPNSYINQSKTDCIECESGQKVKDDNTTCEPCPAGTAGRNGTCEPCPGGQKPNDDNTTCVPCPAGTFGTDGTCSSCSGFKYQDRTGQTSCKDCPSNQVPTSTRQGCQTCANGIHKFQPRCHKADPGCNNWKNIIGTAAEVKVPPQSATRGFYKKFC